MAWAGIGVVPYFFFGDGGLSLPQEDTNETAWSEMSCFSGAGSWFSWLLPPAFLVQYPGFVGLCGTLWDFGCRSVMYNIYLWTEILARSQEEIDGDSADNWGQVNLTSTGSWKQRYIDIEWLQERPQHAQVHVYIYNYVIIYIYICLRNVYLMYIYIYTYTFNPLSIVTYAHTHMISMYI